MSQTEVPEFDLFTARKCPTCKSRNIRRSITCAKIMELGENGKMVTWLQQADAGHFECKDCGFEAEP